MEVLNLEGLSKIFGSGRLEVRALEDINLSVAGAIWWRSWDPAARAKPPCCSAPA